MCLIVLCVQRNRLGRTVETAVVVRLSCSVLVLIDDAVARRRGGAAKTTRGEQEGSEGLPSSSSRNRRGGWGTCVRYVETVLGEI